MGRASTLPRAWLAGGGALGLGILAGYAAQRGAPNASALFLLSSVAALGAGGAYLVWRADPAWTLTAAIVLCPLAGNWEQVGIPGALAVDRLLLAAGIIAVLVRAPAVADRPPLRSSLVHWMLGLTAVYAITSAIASDALFDRAPFFKLLEAFGILPFLAFAVAPLAFRTKRQRSVLLAGLVTLGGYLGVLMILETVGPRALIYPRYIVDASYGIHVDRGRGLFAEAVTNGLGLYVCAVAATVAASVWERGRARFAARAVSVLCLFGTFLTLQRSVWLATVLATVFALLAFRGLRRYLVPLAVGAALLVAGALLVVPGLSDRVQNRRTSQQPVWDRKNLNRAAISMVRERPLVGFGWNGFSHHSADHLQQAPDYPLTAVAQSSLHNVFLTYAVDLGLIGLTLWIASLALAIGGALTARGPPDLRPWRIGLVAIAVFYVVVVSFVPPTVFPTLALWLWAGVVWAGRYQDADA